MNKSTARGKARRGVDGAVNISDLRKIARSKMPRLLFDFVDGGVEDEVALATNAVAYSRIHLLPRYAVNVSTVSQKTAIFGQEFSSPFGICPSGLNAMYQPDGDLVLARVAKEMGIPYTLSSASAASLEQAAKAAAGNLFFQLISIRDRKIVDDFVKRTLDTGVKTLFFTVDVPVHGIRERNIRNGMTLPFRPRLTHILDALQRPQWLGYYLRSGMPVPGNWRAYAAPNAPDADVWRVYNDNMFDPAYTWEDIKRIRDLWPHHFVVKGILSTDDAMRAKSIGANGLVVSNHGGRQLDRAPASIDVLPAIRAAVGPDMTLILDSGIRRGTDIIAALCSGANFCLFGRPTLFGLMAGGEAGVRRAITIFKDEIDMALGQLGCPDIRQLGPKFLARNQQ